MPIGTILAGFKFVSWFVKFKDFIGAAIVALFQVIGKYPLQALCVLVLGIAGYFTYDYIDGLKQEIKAHQTVIEKQAKTISEQGEQLAEYQLKDGERKAKIKELEASSKVAAENAAKDLKHANQQYVAIVNAYEKKLADAKANPKIKYETIYVSVPGTTEQVKVEFEDGQQVCGRYPSAYKETVNDLVRIHNQTLKGVTQ